MSAVDPIHTSGDWRQPDDPALVVSHVPLFAKLARRQARKLRREVELATFAPGDVVLADGAAAEFLYVVLRGEGELSDGGETQRIRPGDYFGEAGLLDRTHESARAIATGELQVLRLPGSVFLQLLRRNPSVAFAVLRHVGDRVRGGDPRLIVRPA